MNRRAFGVHLLTDEQVEIALKNGLNESTLAGRLCIPPIWTVDKAIHTPIRKFVYQEVRWTKQDVKEAEENGIHYELFQRRMRDKFTLEDAKTIPPIKRRRYRL